MSDKTTNKNAMLGFAIALTSPIYTLFASWFMWTLWGWSLVDYVSQPKLVSVWGLMTMATWMRSFIFERLSKPDIDYGYVFAVRFWVFPMAAMMALGILFIAQKVM